MSVGEATGASSRRRPGRVPWRQWRWRRLPWLAASLVCVLAAALASFLMPLRADPWQPDGGIASPDFWLAPVETNGFRRLPAITATLTSVALLADGKTALAVGWDGTILRSGDGGQSWSAARSGTTAHLHSVALLADGKTALAVGAGRHDPAQRRWRPKLERGAFGDHGDPDLGGAVGRRQDRAGGGSWGHDPAQRRWRPKLERGGFGDHGIPDLGGAVGRRQDRAGGGLGRHDPAQRRWRPKLERGAFGDHGDPVPRWRCWPTARPRWRWELGARSCAAAMAAKAGARRFRGPRHT